MTINPPQLEIEIPEYWAGRTVQSYLRSELHLSRTQIRVLKETDGILIDSQLVWTSYRLQGGENLVLIITPLKQNITPEQITLEIVYEDPDLVVVNKPAGMVVHPVGVYKTGTLANALVYHWLNNSEAASFHPVHRLDRLTSGLILVAKNPWSHQQLARQIEAGLFHRLYLAVCCGTPPRISAKLTAPLKRAEIGLTWEVAKEGISAITRFRVLHHSATSSLLAVRLFTGRTHQIRVHLAHLGIPLRGDLLYGCPESSFFRPALHAVRLVFKHPRSNRKIKLTVDPPDDFLQQI